MQLNLKAKAVAATLAISDTFENTKKDIETILISCYYSETKENEKDLMKQKIHFLFAEINNRINKLIGEIQIDGRKHLADKGGAVNG